jgi:predicted nucleic acid-binding protein
VCATQHDFDDDDAVYPDAVLLDADFVVNVLHEGEDYHKVCLAFAEELLTNHIVLITTPLLKIEFFAGWRSAVHRGGIPETERRQAQLWEDEDTERARAFAMGSTLIDGFLRQFDQYEVRLTKSLQRHAMNLMTDYNLKPLDAWLVAAGRRVEVPDLVSLDHAMTKIDRLELWNHHIPDKRKAKHQRQRLSRSSARS